eukprot:scaffold2752_cov393-Prasinococcus_capsulatus_cf.AAC.20
MRLCAQACWVRAPPPTTPRLTAIALQLQRSVHGAPPPLTPAHVYVCMLGGLAAYDKEICPVQPATAARPREDRPRISTGALPPRGPVQRRPREAPMGAWARGAHDS